MSKELKLVVGIVAAGVIAVLAFGVFGVQTLFFDSEANEAVPVFSTGSSSGLASDDVDSATTEEMNEAMEADKTSSELEADDEMPAVPDEIIRLVEGSFVDRTHPGSGTAVVLTNGRESQRFLRLEDNFETDNGPDLNVYLVAGVDAESDSGLFDDDAIDLGDLKGNIGAQNYELGPEIDLDVYNTVVIWCVRFGVAFTVADLS
jgi:hypothetical protein